MQSISDLLVDKKTVSFGPMTFELKKFSSLVQAHSYIKMLETKGETKESVTFDQVRDTACMRIVHGVAKWSFTEPVSLESARLLEERAPEIFDFLLKEIDQFNKALSEDKKK